MKPGPSLAEALASAFVAGDLTVEGVVERGTRALGLRRCWLPLLARRYVKTFSGGIRPRRQAVVQFILQDRASRRFCERHSADRKAKHWLIEPQKMQPAKAAAKWQIPAIESAGGLADWLGVDIGYLQWFADLKGLGYKSHNPKLRHYHYRILAKDSGSIRLIEAPKQALKKLQQRILNDILDKVPAHAAAHGFVNARSIKTCVAPHVGKRVVLRMDVRNFFPTFHAVKIRSFFRMLGYPETVADLLCGICTTVTPLDLWRGVSLPGDRTQLWETRMLYFRPHLPQGAPTSPSLANLCSYRIDCRLAGLAKSASAHYTRYGDDLAFSGDKEFEKRVERFSIHVAAVLLEEGFEVHHRKTRIMRQGVRQHIVGLVANQHPNIRRTHFDRLKAILTNCVRQGPKTQNRDGLPDFRAHLEGRVSFVEMINPAKGSRLRTVFEQIRWK